jgi:putative GTP pyrophosphokinase
LGTRFWKEFLLPYDQAVEEILLKFKSIKKQYQALGDNPPFESVSGRTKSISSILEKVKKYGIDVDEIENCIEDIAGVRIICQFQEDIEEVISIIEERSKYDMTIVKVKDYLNDVKDSGYRSYHIIIKYPVITALGYKEIYAEIQIRTLAMNFWSVIEHSLNYKYNENVPEDIQKRLKHTSKVVYELDKEMAEIRKEIRDAQRLFGLKSSTVTNILDSIGNMYKLNQGSKALKYEKIFEELFEEEDIIQLILLKKELEEEVNKITEDE